MDIGNIIVYIILALAIIYMLRKFIGFFTGKGGCGCGGGSSVKKSSSSCDCGGSCGCNGLKK